VIVGLAETLWHKNFGNEVMLLSPEIFLAIGMCAVIIVPFFKRDSVKLPAGAAILSLIAALFATGFAGNEHESILYGAMVVDPFSRFFKILLLTFTLLIVAQWMIVRDRNSNRLDIPDFLCLLLGATFGMSLMASASNLLTIFIAIEAASLPSFALAGFRKYTRAGTEGSLKYVIFGAASSAVMLYGMSLVFGATGSLELSDIAQAAARDGMNPMLAIGLLGLLSGIAFKLSAVPLHFWCPDVFEGAPIEVTTFLSVASKGAAIILLVRVLSAFGAAAYEVNDMTLFTGLTTGVALLGAATATWGNLVAYHQTNIKRLLAYSSIAHAGYMIMAVAFLPVSDFAKTGDITSAILFYLVVYLFMNLGAFTIAAMIARRTGSYEISDYTNMRERNPVLAALMMLCLLSLFGMPGLGGFMGKAFLIMAMKGGGVGGLVVIAVLLINTLISLFYYLRPIETMYLRPDDQNRPAIAGNQAGLTLVLACAFMLIVTGVLPSMTHDHVQAYPVLNSSDMQPRENKSAPKSTPNPSAKKSDTPKAGTKISETAQESKELSSRQNTNATGVSSTDSPSPTKPAALPHHAGADQKLSARP
jgi:NADH-quinone oxidoreductase subunit N